MELRRTVLYDPCFDLDDGEEFGKPTPEGVQKDSEAWE